MEVVAEDGFMEGFTFELNVLEMAEE